MEYIIVKPNCIGCGKEIDKPADTDMELFRLGLTAHIDCIKIYENLAKIVERLKG